MNIYMDIFLLKHKFIEKFSNEPDVVFLSPENLNTLLKTTPNLLRNPKLEVEGLEVIEVDTRENVLDVGFKQWVRQGEVIIYDLILNSPTLAVPPIPPFTRHKFPKYQTEALWNLENPKEPCDY